MEAYIEEGIVKLCDVNEKQLKLYHYTEVNDRNKNIRGDVYDGDKLIMRTFPYTPEYCSTDINTDLNPNPNLRIFYSYEGCLLRLFYYNEEWHLSTHKRLDAFNSRWSSRTSFGETFVQALDEEFRYNAEFRNFMGTLESTDLYTDFINKLDKDRQYTFLLLNTPDNYLVCVPPKRPRVYYTGYFKDFKYNFDDENVLGMCKPKEVKDSLDVEKLNFREFQGYIVFKQDEDGNTDVYKIMNKEYHEYSKVRGNQMNIRFRYLEIRLDPDMVNKISVLYPHYITEFSTIENTLNNVGQYILSVYIDRFVKKQYITTPKIFFNIIREAHSWHISDRPTHRVNLTKIMEIINSRDALTLHRMIKRFLILKELL